MWEPKTPPPTIIPVSGVCCFWYENGHPFCMEERVWSACTLTPGSQSRFLCWKNGHTSMRDHRFYSSPGSAEDTQRSCHSPRLHIISAPVTLQKAPKRPAQRGQRPHTWPLGSSPPWGVSQSLQKGCVKPTAPGVENECSKGPSMPHKLCSAIANSWKWKRIRYTSCLVHVYTLSDHAWQSRFAKFLVHSNFAKLQLHTSPLEKNTPNRYFLVQAFANSIACILFGKQQHI
jgi:hypothetical protein